MKHALCACAINICMSVYPSVVTATSGVVSPGYMSNPPATGYVNNAVGPYTYGNYVPGASAACGGGIWVYSGNENGKYYFNTYLESNAGKPADGGVNCYGEFISTKMTKNEATEAMTRILSRPVSFPLNSPNLPNYYPARANTCSFSVSFRYGPKYGYVISAYANTYYTRPDECRMESNPEPVHCNVYTPGTITHRTTNVGSVRATAYGQLNIECNRETDVTISVGDTYLDLASADGLLESRIYVDETGQQSTRLHANPRVDVTLISFIDTVTTRPGVYHGAKLITVTWD